MQHWHLTSKVLTVVLMRIQVFQVVNAMSLQGWFPTPWRWQEHPTQQKLLTQWHRIISQNTQIFNMSPVMSTYNNVRVFENCTRMWPPAISVIYCQHHDWVYKQLLYVMLKYGFLQRGTITTFHQENKNFSHIKEKKEGTENFWYFESGVI